MIVLKDPEFVFVSVLRKRHKNQIFIILEICEGEIGICEGVFLFRLCIFREILIHIYKYCSCCIKNV